MNLCCFLVFSVLWSLLSMQRKNLFLMKPISISRMPENLSWDSWITNAYWKSYNLVRLVSAGSDNFFENESAMLSQLIVRRIRRGSFGSNWKGYNSNTGVPIGRCRIRNKRSNNELACRVIDRPDLTIKPPVTSFYGIFQIVGLC